MCVLLFFTSTATSTWTSTSEPPITSTAFFSHYFCCLSLRLNTELTIISIPSQSGPVRLSLPRPLSHPLLALSSVPSLSPSSVPPSPTHPHHKQDYFVEIDVVMDANTPLWKAHDLSQQLQDKLEVLPNVGRAFVHVDHETTHRPVSFPHPSTYVFVFEDFGGVWRLIVAFWGGVGTSQGSIIGFVMAGPFCSS